MNIFLQKLKRISSLHLVCSGILFVLGCAGPSTTGQLTELEISDGNLRGAPLADNIDVIAFKSIPYAKAPIGDLRWTSPQPPQPWKGTLDVTESPPACIQQITPASPESYSTLPQSEDCLYLNVFTPRSTLQDPDQAAPVLFLIHGGGRTRSAVTRIQADIAAFNREGIVVVTPQYRLGIFSFFAHPELSAESVNSVSGNYGMQDLVEALKWVQTNIASFGGDPKSVTILGPSGGGTATGILLATPLAKGLFHRAAPLCSNAGIARMHRLKDTYLDQPSAEELGVRFAQSLNADSLNAMRALPASRIQRHIFDAEVASYDAPSGAGDVIDGWMLPQSIIELHQTGARNDVPVMLGFNADEVSVFASADLIGPVPINQSAYEEFIHSQYGDFSHQFLKQYPGEKHVDAIYHAARDRVVSFGSQTLTRYSHKVTSPTYLYYMTHRPADADQIIDDSGTSKGVSHCTGYKYFTGWEPAPSLNEIDRRLAETMSGYLINFIKTGNPNDTDPGQTELPKWQPYDASVKNYMRFEFGKAQPSTNLLPGMWDLHESIRLHDEEQGRFRHWLGGWASDASLTKSKIASE